MLLGQEDVPCGSVCEMATAWSASQCVSQQLPPECCLTALSASSVIVPLLRSGVHCRSEADKGLRIPSQHWEPAMCCPGGISKGHQPAPSQHIPAPTPSIKFCIRVISAAAHVQGSCTFFFCTPFCSMLHLSTLGHTPAHFVLCSMFGAASHSSAAPHVSVAAPRMPCTAPQTCLYPCRDVDTPGSLLSFGGTGLWDLGAQNMDPPSFIQRLVPQFPPQFTHLVQMGTPSGDRNVEWGHPLLELW